MVSRKVNDMSDKLDEMGKVLYQFGYSTRFVEGGYYVVNAAGDVVSGPFDDLEAVADSLC